MVVIPVYLGHSLFQMINGKKRIQCSSALRQVGLGIFLGDPQPDFFPESNKFALKAFAVFDQFLGVLIPLHGQSVELHFKIHSH